GSWSATGTAIRATGTAIRATGTAIQVVFICAEVNAARQGQSKGSSTDGREKKKVSFHRSIWTQHSFTVANRLDVLHYGKFSGVIRKASDDGPFIEGTKRVVAVVPAYPQNNRPDVFGSVTGIVRPLRVVASPRLRDRRSGRSVCHPEGIRVSGVIIGLEEPEGKFNAGH